MKISYALVLTVSLCSGCATYSGIDYYTYRQKIETCEQFDMKVHVVRAVHNRVPYVKGVMCRDEYGAFWDTEEL